MNQPKIYLFASLFFFSTILAAQTKKSPGPGLDGKWISKTDPKYSLSISKGWIIEYYQGRKTADTFKYEIHTKSCLPVKWPAGKTWFLQKEDKTGRPLYCYKLLSYSSNAFAMLAQDNKTYHFIRYLKHY